MKTIVLTILLALSPLAGRAEVRSVAEAVKNLKFALDAESVSSDWQRSRTVSMERMDEVFQTLSDYNKIVHPRSHHRNVIAKNVGRISLSNRMVATVNSAKVVKDYLVRMHGSFANRPEVKASIETATETLTELLDNDMAQIGFDSNGVNGCGHREVMILVIDLARQEIHSIETEACEL